MWKFKSNNIEFFIHASRVLLQVLSNRIRSSGSGTCLLDLLHNTSWKIYWFVNTAREISLCIIWYYISIETDQISNVIFLNPTVYTQGKTPVFLSEWSKHKPHIDNIIGIMYTLIKVERKNVEINCLYDERFTLRPRMKMMKIIFPLEIMTVEV